MKIESESPIVWRGKFRGLECMIKQFNSTFLFCWQSKPKIWNSKPFDETDPIHRLALEMALTKD